MAPTSNLLWALPGNMLTEDLFSGTAEVNGPRGRGEEGLTQLGTEWRCPLQVDPCVTGEGPREEHLGTDPH